MGINYINEGVNEDRLQIVRDGRSVLEVCDDGSVKLVQDPVDDLDAATKAYVDTHGGGSSAPHGPSHISTDPIPNATAGDPGLMSAADKAKLNGIAAGANNYTHPANHPPSIITQDANNRFVTDAEKAAWNAKQAALGFTPENSANKGVGNGYAGLDGTGRVPSAQLPSYVDDVLEYANLAGFPGTGESGKIYTAIDTNKIYRWSGSAYVEISASLALGETSSTAYSGDRGKVAYDHAQITAGNPHNTTKAHVGLGNVPNVDTTNPANITQSAPYRFVTDAEKAAWNAKEAGFTKNTAFNKNFGSAAGTVCEGNDARLSNARTPVAHNQAASTITVVDSNNYFDGTNAEAVFDELGDDLVNHTHVTATATAPAISLPSTVQSGEMGFVAKGNTVVNSIINGSFEQDMTGWTWSGSGTAAVDTSVFCFGSKSMHITVAAITRYFRQKIVFPEGNKIYVSACYRKVSGTAVNSLINVQNYDASSPTAVVSAAMFNSATTNQWVKNSVIKTSTNGGVEVVFGNTSATATFEAYFDGFMVIDLTAMFGAGNEPTQAWCDAAFNYIDGVKDVGPTRLTATGQNIWGSKKAADDVVRIVNNTTITYLATIDNRNCLVIKGTESIRNKLFFDKFKPNTQYTFRFWSRRNEANSGGFLFIKYSDETTINLSPFSTTWEDRVIVSTPGKTIVGIYATYSYNTLNYYDYDTFQVNEGSTVFPYTPYTSTETYLPAIGSGLPNGVVDTVDDEGIRTQNISDWYTLKASDVTNIYTARTNVDIVLCDTLLPNQKIIPGDYVIKGHFIIPGMPEEANSGADNTSSIGKYYTHPDNGFLRFIVAKGAFGSVATAQAALAGTRMKYQIATPITTPISTNSLIARQNGSIFVETGVNRFRAKPVSGVLTIPDTTYPIASIESVRMPLPLADNREYESVTPASNTATTITLPTGSDAGRFYEVVYFSEPTALPTLEYNYATTTRAQIEDLVDQNSGARDNISVLQSVVDDISDDLEESRSIQYNFPPAAVLSLPATKPGALNLTVQGNTVHNVVKNGDFANGTTGWSTSASTHAVANNILTNTSTGANLRAYSISSLTTTNVLGRKMYACARLKVTNSSATLLSLYLEGRLGQVFVVTNMVGSVSTPAQGVEYLISGVYTSPSSGIDELRIALIHDYPDAATANGKAMEVREVFAVDLTTMFGSGNEPTKEWCDTAFSFVDGVQDVGPTRITATGKNLFNPYANPLSSGNVTISQIPDGINVSSNTASTYRVANYALALEPNTQYTMAANISINSGKANFSVRTLTGSSAIGTTGTVTINGYYKFTFVSPLDGILKILFHCTLDVSESGNVNFTNIMFVKGSLDVPYEPYVSTEAYRPAIGGSLPNGVADTVDDYKRVQRIGVKYYSTAVGFNPYTHTTNHYYFARFGDITNVVPNTSPAKELYIGSAKIPFAYTETDNEHFYTDASGSALIIFIAKTKIDAMVGATPLGKFNAYLTANPITLKYELATPVITSVDTGSLIARPNGSIIVEPIIKFRTSPVSGVITIPDTTWAIQTVQSVHKIVLNDDHTEYEPVTTSNTTTTITLPTGYDDAALYEVVYAYQSKLYAYPTISCECPTSTAGRLEGSMDHTARLEDTVNNVQTGLAVLNNRVPALSRYVTTTAAGEGWYRVATIPMSSAFRNAFFKVKAYTATGTTTESTIMVNMAYYSGSYASQGSAIVAHTSHSFNSETNAENGWVLRYCRVSFDGTSGYIDFYKFKTTVVTIEIEPLLDNDWVWATGTLTVNPAVGAYRNVQATLTQGIQGNYVTAQYAGYSTYTNYGVNGGNILSNTTNKAGLWAYCGYWALDYNASYLRGRSGNIRIRVEELSHDGTKAPADLENFVLTLKVNLGYHANNTEFNTTVPTFSIEIEGNTILTGNDVAVLVFSTSTSQKLIRLYIRVPGANTVYLLNPEQRYGRSFATSTFAQTISYCVFTYVNDQTPIATLPTPAQGSVVYATKRASASDTETTQELTIFVNNNTGSDSLGNGSSGSPFATIPKALSQIPRIINHPVVLVLEGGPYEGIVELRDFRGSSTFELFSTSTFRCLRLVNIQCLMRVSGVQVSAVDGALYVGNNMPRGLIEVIGCSIVGMAQVNINANALNYLPGVVSVASHVYLQDSVVNNTYAVVQGNEANVIVKNCSGTNNEYLFEVTSGTCYTNCDWLMGASQICQASPDTAVFRKDGNGNTQLVAKGFIDSSGNPIDLSTQITSHLADYVRQPGYGVTTGSANNYVLTLSPAPTAYVDGMGIRIKIHASNGGTSTINVNGLGVKTLVDSKGSNFTSGKLRTAGSYTFVYNSTSANFILQGEGGDYGTAGAAQVLTGYTVGTASGVVSGSMPNRAGDTVCLASSVSGTTLKLRASDGYRDGVDDNVTITDANFSGSNIKKDTTMFGVTGTYEASAVSPAPALDTWTIRTSAANNYWNSVCYGNGMFVAVAEDGAGTRVMTSPNGINWTIRTSAADNYWNSVCYGNGMFVAVSYNGSGNRVMTSPDGINWTIRTSAANNAWLSVCYGNGMFVAVSDSGSGNKVMTSPDGINWTIRASATNNYWASVCYGNGMFVAVAYSGVGNRVMTSPDGINWTIRTSAADNNWTSICYGNGMFVAIAYSGVGNRVMTSPDGINWTIRTSAADNNWLSVCYGNGMFVAVGSTGTGNRVMTSPDGINWTIGVSAFNNSWKSVCYGNGLFVAVAYSGSGNRVMTASVQGYALGNATQYDVLQDATFSSKDGLAITGVRKFMVKDITNVVTRTAAESSYYSVCYGNGLFVAVSYGAVITSSNGINWVTIASAPSNNYRSVCYGNGMFVAVANTSSYLANVTTSPDGINWTRRNAAVDNRWYSVCYGNGLFVAVSQTGTGNRVMTSSDGINWTTRTSAADNNWQSVCYGNGMFVAVDNSGTSNSVMTSPDGINWTMRTASVGNGWQSVCYGNGLFVAVANSGAGNRVMTSPDGINWTTRTSAADNSWYSVCYGNGLFVAVAQTGTGNRTMISIDGINWTIRTSAADNSWYSVCYGNGMFVAACIGGTGDRIMTMDALGTLLTA